MSVNVRKTRAKVSLAAVRTLVADHIRSEGCSCCRNDLEHERTIAGLAKLLKVPMYKDGSGYDFSKFRTSERE